MDSNIERIRFLRQELYDAFGLYGHSNPEERDNHRDIADDALHTIDAILVNVLELDGADFDEMVYGSDKV